MKKVSIIYWSNGGNVELLANHIADGVKSNDVEVEIKHVIDATEDDIINSDGVAIGSPAMMNDEIEQLEMKPFIESLIKINFNKKPLILFGSCGWREPKFINNWQDIMENHGFNVIGKVVLRESLNTEEIRKAEALGKELAKIC